MKLKQILAALAGLAIMLLTARQAKAKPAAQEQYRQENENAEKAKETKESEIEKTDSSTLLEHSARADANSAKLEQLIQANRERIRDRIRENLQQ